MRRSLALLLPLLLGLSACLGGGAPPIPRDNYYRVMVTPPARSETLAFPGVIAVAPLEADGLLRERPLLYSESGEALRMQQHDYHYWIDPPTRMLQTELVDYLRGSGLALSVVTPELRIEADFEVIGRIKRLERLLGGGPPRVVAELELAMIQREGEGDRLMIVETYAAEVRAEDDSVSSSILAMNQALTQIFERFLADAGRSRTAKNPAAQ